MSSFISKEVTGWYPKVGELVIGFSGKREFRGIVMESKKKKGKPAIFTSRGGAVLLYIKTDYGKIVAVNEVRPFSL